MTAMAREEICTLFARALQGVTDETSPRLLLETVAFLIGGLVPAALSKKELAVEDVEDAVMRNVVAGMEDFLKTRPANNN